MCMFKDECENAKGHCARYSPTFKLECGLYKPLKAKTEPVAKLHCSRGLNRIAELEDELRVTDHLLSERQRVLDAIPECEVHGPCVPHALEWIEKAKKRGRSPQD